jgi:ATP-dependent exoDNAse (exonuclease V) beta subunit
MLRGVSRWELFTPSHFRNSSDCHVARSPGACCQTEKGWRYCVAASPSIRSTASFEDVVKNIDSAKARIRTPVFAHPGIEAIYIAYQDTLASEGAMDFADIVLLAVQKISSGELLPLPVRWLLVDEAQDMDEVQVAWVKAHGLAGVEVTLVGDDDQSLYAFRHAMGYAGLIEVTETLASNETTLPLNYRCAPNILEPCCKADRTQQGASAETYRGSQDIHRRYPDSQGI